MSVDLVQTRVGGVIFALSSTVNGRHVGPEGVLAAVRQLHEAFGRPHMSVEDLLAEEDGVVLRWGIRDRRIPAGDARAPIWCSGYGSPRRSGARTPSSTTTG